MGNLLDLMDMQGVPPEIQKMVNGYELHLLEVRKFEDIELFRSDLREVFGAIQCAGDKEKVREFIHENEHNLKRMEGKMEGKLSGKSEALLLFLTQLESVPESLEKRIMEEEEISVLERWIGMVPHVKSVEEFVEKM